MRFLAELGMPPRELRRGDDMALRSAIEAGDVDTLLWLVGFAGVSMRRWERARRKAKENAGRL